MKTKTAKMKVFTKKGLYLENLGLWLMLATFGYKPAQSMALTSFKLSAKELAILLVTDWN